MTGKVTKHPIAEYGEHLLPRNLNLLDEQLNSLFNAGKEYLDGHSTAVHEAGKLKGNRDFTKEAIARKQRELLGKNSPAKIQQALQGIIRTTAAMRARIQEDARPQGPETDTRALLQYMQRRDLLADLRELKQEGKGEEIVKLLTRTTQRGDRSILDALQSSLKPLIAPQMLEAAEGYYVQATQREALENLETQEEIEAAARLAVRQITGKAETMVKAAEVDGDLLPKPPDLKTASPVASLSDSQKSDLISKVGSAGYQAIVKGEMALPLEYALSDETKAAMKEWAGDTAFAEIMAGTRELPEKFAPAPAE
ncbi:MAG: hypothetical protein NTY36_01935 [Deltaproteobacteria bacterium]|nr:hypothetical protein [Deltaproteobacteria bacterium]